MKGRGEAADALPDLAISEALLVPIDDLLIRSLDNRRVPQLLEDQRILICLLSDLYESSRHGRPPGFLLVHLRYLSSKQSWAFFSLYHIAAHAVSHPCSSWRQRRSCVVISETAKR